MTDTGGERREEGAGTPTPREGEPPAVAPGSGDVKPPDGDTASPPTPPSGWQPPTPPPAPPVPPGGYGPPPQYPGGPLPQYQGGPAWNPHGLGKPGVIALRPLNIGDILDGAITAIRRHPAVVLGTGVVVAVLSAALTFLEQRFLLDDLRDLGNTTQLGPAATEQELRNAVFGTFADLFLVLIPALLVSTLLVVLTTGVMAAVMGKAALGRPVTFGSVWADVKPRLLPLLGVAFVYSLVTLIGGMLCIIPGVIAYVFWALAAPSLILERGTFRDAFRRSAKLVSGAFWRVFGILLLAGVIEYLFDNIISLPFSLGTGVFQGLMNPGKVFVPSTGDLLLQSVGQIISGTIATPFFALVTVIVYLDQRMRREGMDIELARAAGVTPPQAW